MPPTFRTQRELVRNRITGPWLRAARFDGGLLLPGRPGGRAFDLLLTPEHALIRGSGELVLPWTQHLDFTRDLTSSRGWYVSAWGGRGDALGAAVHLLGDLEQQSRALPTMQTWSARWARTPNWGSLAPLHPLTLVSRQADVEVVHALCTTLALRADLRPRLADADTVHALLARIAATPHACASDLEGVRRVTIETSNALRALGCTHPVGGRPLPDRTMRTADELLPAVLERIRASPYAHGVTVDEQDVRALIERGFSRRTPWPFEPLFHDVQE